MFRLVHSCSQNVICSLRNTLDNALPQDDGPKFVYTGTKVSVKFQIKDKTKGDHSMILYIMQNVQNGMKVMYEKQEENCKTGLMNVREKIVTLTF